jgi:hypothetical protein
MSAPSRIVLDADTRQTVDAIQARTRTTSPSAAIALMVSRYGRHLIETWELTAAQSPNPPIEPYLAGGSTASASPVSVAPPDFQFSESIEL